MPTISPPAWPSPCAGCSRRVRCCWRASSTSAGAASTPTRSTARAPPANHGLEIGLRYNLNTLEQCLLVAIAWPALATSVPHAQLAFIPAMACLFVAGRIAFWTGYLLHPTARAFGMTMTVLPTAAAYVWLAIRWP